jgi:hypothetical protein
MMGPIRDGIVSLGGLALLALAGCADGGPAKGAARVVGFAWDAPESKEFVRDTRPAQLEYIPVGTKIEREARKLTPAEFSAIERELDDARARNEAAGAEAKAAGATPPPAPIKLPR